MALILTSSKIGKAKNPKRMGISRHGKLSSKVNLILSIGGFFHYL